MITLTGKMSTFGGPDDHGVAPNEGLALFNSVAQCPSIFLATQPHGTTGLARRLNPVQHYIACRWDYKKTPVAFLRTAKVVVTNPANSKTFVVQPADYGPNISTRRVTCLSPGLASDLGLETDEVCTVEIPEPLNTQHPPKMSITLAPKLNITPKFVDLSHYDDLQDIQKVKAAGILGIVNKATEGPGMVDTTYHLRRSVVEGVGLKYGGYHFVRPGNMDQQATKFLTTIGDPTGLMLMGDWEVKTVSVPAYVQWCGAVHDKLGMHGTARWPVTYSYASMLIEMLGRTKPNDVLSKTKLWDAAYNMHPDWPHQIWQQLDYWQFTGDGLGSGPHTIPGIVLPGGHGIDIDAYEGGGMHATDHTDAELLAGWAS